MMLDLQNLQASIRASLHAGKMAEALAQAIVSDTLSAGQRFQVYTNTYYRSLIDVLLAVYPCIQVFVGDKFARHVFSAYIKKKPPTEPALHEYGVGMADFLSSFEAAQTVPYLPDLAQLEWAVHCLQYSAEPCAAMDVRLNPCYQVIESRFPLLSLWMAGQGQVPPESISQDSGGQVVCAVLTKREVRLVTLTANEKAILDQLALGTAKIDLENTIIQSLAKKGLLIKGGQNAQDS